jgi:hypothetical protein
MMILSGAEPVTPSAPVVRDLRTDAWPIRHDRVGRLRPEPPPRSPLLDTAHRELDQGGTPDAGSL